MYVLRFVRFMVLIFSFTTFTAPASRLYLFHYRRNDRSEPAVWRLVFYPPVAYSNESNALAALALQKNPTPCAAPFREWHLRHFIRNRAKQLPGRPLQILNRSDTARRHCGDHSLQMLSSKGCQ
jgi:hypothetical protein